MKLIVSKKEFLDALKLFKVICPPRPSTPILKTVRLVARENNLEIHGTDLDTFLRFRCPAKVSGAGEAALDLRALEKVAKIVSKGLSEIEMEISEGEDGPLFVMDGAVLPAISADDFPLEPAGTAEPGGYRISACHLQEGLKRVLPFVRKDGDTPLGHVLWNLGKDGLRLISSDGHRLSMTVIPVTGIDGVKSSSENETGIIPQRACKVLEKAFKISGKDQLDFAWKKGTDKQQGLLTCRFGMWRMDVRLDDGVYPEYRQILQPKGLKASVDARSLEQITRRIIMVTQASLGNVDSPALFQLRQGGLTISAGHQELAQTVKGEKIPCEYGGGSFDVAFNAKYLADILKLADGKVDIFFGNEESVATFVISPDWQYLLMPLSRDVEDPFPYPATDTTAIPSLKTVDRSRKHGLKSRKSRPKKTVRAPELLSRLKKIEEENRKLRSQIHSLSQKEETKRHMNAPVPLEILPDGKAMAEVNSKKIAFLGGKIFSVDSNKLLGTYDRNTGLGLLGKQPVWIRNLGQNWMLQALDSVHEPHPEYVLERARQIIRDKFFAKGSRIKDPRDAADAIQTWLAPNDREVFAGIFLDAKNRILAFKELNAGTVNHAVIYAREVIREALGLNASAVIFAHNHPSGDTEPSDHDILLTQKLKKALDLVEIRVLDHLIVGRDVTSMQEKGLI